MRPETITSWDRGRDQDQLPRLRPRPKKWSRDHHVGLETLTSLLFAAAKCHVTSFKRFMKQIKRLKKFDRKLRCSAAGVYVAESIKMSARMEQFYHSFLCPCTGSYCTAAVQPVAHLINYVFGLFYLFTYFSTLWTTSDGGHLHASGQSHRLIIDGHACLFCHIHMKQISARSRATQHVPLGLYWLLLNS